MSSGGRSSTGSRRGRYAFEPDEAGTPVVWNVFTGVPVPRMGDQLVLFLPTDGSTPCDGWATHAVNELDGIGFLDDNTVTITDRSARRVRACSA